MTNPQHEALVEAVARALRERALEEQAGDSMLFAEFGGWGDDDDFQALACTAIAALSATAATPSDEVVREQYRHVKRGTMYEVIGTASLQIATGDLVDGSDLVIYRGEDGKLWARETGEFHDGRFAPETDVRKGSS